MPQEQGLGKALSRGSVASRSAGHEKSGPARDGLRQRRLDERARRVSSGSRG
jgi:hypothetical protein